MYSFSFFFLLSVGVRTYLKTELLVLSKVELSTKEEDRESCAKTASGPCAHKVVRQVNRGACMLRKAFISFEELRSSQESLILVLL